MADRKMSPATSQRGQPTTPLDRFIRSRGLRPNRVASEANLSRQHLLRLRNGTDEPTRPTMVRLAEACARLLGERVRVADLFDLADAPAPLVHVSRVTPEHAKRFVTAWLKAMPDEALSVGFLATNVMVWPDRDALVSEMTPAQETFSTLKHDILKRTAELVSDALGRAFLKAANEVFRRERQRQRANG